jgi:hypothetical protein
MPYDPNDWSNVGPSQPIQPQVEPFIPPVIQGHVLNILAQLQRPRFALAAAARNTFSSDPNATVWGGLKAGATLQDQPSWGDVLGVQEPGPDASTSEWALRHLARTGLDVALDPLWLIPGLKIPEMLRATKPVMAAKDYYAGSGIGRWLGGKTLPRGVVSHGIEYDPTQAIIEQRTAEASAVPQRKIAAQGAQEMEKALEGTGYYPEDVTRALEDGPMDARLAPAIDAMHPLQFENDAAFAEHNAARARIGLPEVAPAGDAVTPYFPHVQQTPRSGPVRSGRPMDSTYALKQAEIQRWVDPETGEPLLDQLGRPVIGKASDPRTGITQIGPNEFEYRQLPMSEGGPNYYGAPEREAAILPAKPMRASLQDMEQIMPESTPWVTHPAAALDRATVGLTRKTAFLNMMGDLEESGAITRNLMGDWQVPLNIPGFPARFTTPAIRNVIENKARLLYEPGMSGGPVNDLLTSIVESGPGRLLSDLNQTWKNSVLALHPARYFADRVATVGQQYAQGMNPWNWPGRTMDAIQTLRNIPEEFLPGVTYSKFGDKMAARNLMESSWAATEGTDALTQATRAPGRIRSAIGNNPVGNAVATVGEKIGAAQQWGYRNIGRPLESTDRLAVSADWLKKNAPDIANRPLAEQEALYDQAAQAGKNLMGDYSNKTPLDRAGSLVVPFWGYHRNLLDRTMDIALNNPARLSSFGTALDAAFTPLSPEDKAIADLWIKEQGPVTGVFGHDFSGIKDKLAQIPYLGKLFEGGDTSGNPQMALTQRYIAPGFIENLIARPSEAIAGAISPWLKAPVEMYTNYSQFKHRPIDTIAGSGLEALFNPIIGGDYEKSKQTEFGHALPASWDYLAHQLPGGRYLAAINNWGRSLGAWDDPNKAAASPGEAAGWWMSGGKIFPFDRIRYMQNRQREWQTKESAIKRDLTFAMMKGDSDAIPFYLDMLVRHGAERGKVLGFSEGE